jgi:hypothetical protein
MTLYAQDYHFGSVVTQGGYREMPYMARLPSGNIFMCVTTSASAEGGADQHVESWKSADNGVSWTNQGVIDPASFAETSWGIPWVDPSIGTLGRIWVVEQWNKNNVRAIPFSNNPAISTARVDSIGWHRFKFSDDEGLTWSVLNGPGTQGGWAIYPATDIDLRNVWGGTHRLSWLSGHTAIYNGYVYYGFSKAGRFETPSWYVDTEAFIGRMPITPVDNSNLTVLPTGMTGIRVPHTWPNGVVIPSAQWNVCEEPCFDFFEDGVMYGVARTATGRVMEFISADQGSTVTTGWAQMADSPSGKTVYHPRSKCAVTNLGGGTWFMWTNNTAETDFTGRNVAYYRLGTRSGNRVIWGDPCALVFNSDLQKSISYPSRPLDVGNDYLIACGDKSSIKTFLVPKARLLGL